VRDRAERRIFSDLREGRREAYEAVIDAHYGSVYRFLLYLTGESSLAEDLTQEVFASAWAAIDRYQGRASIRTWLHRIAYNAHVDAHRRRGRREALAATVDRPSSEAVVDPVAQASVAEDIASMRQALAELDTDDRAVLVLHYVEGLSYREMAQVLEQPTGTVKWLTSRALRRLRSQMAGKEQL